MKQSNSNLLLALREAQENGYPHDFLFDEKGNLLSNTGEVANPKVIEVIPCHSCGATLYLIACDNMKGTLIDHWEQPKSN